MLYPFQNKLNIFPATKESLKPQMDSQSRRHRSRLIRASSVTASVTQKCTAAPWFTNIQTRSSFPTYLQHESTGRRHTGATEMPEIQEPM